MPPELEPFIEAMAELLVADHLRREAEGAAGLTVCNQEAPMKLKVKTDNVRDDFPPGFHEALGAVALEFGRLEYRIKLAIKDLEGEGFIAGMEKAAESRNFRALCQGAKKLAAEKLSEPHRTTFAVLMDQAIELASDRNDNLHAFWTAVGDNTAKRICLYYNGKTKKLESRNRVMTPEDLQSDAKEIRELYDAIIAARIAWPSSAPTAAQ